MTDTLSFRLMKCLHRGVKSLDDEARSLVRDFVRSQMIPDSVAFGGRGKHADVYYTAFGWLLSYCLSIPLDAMQRKEFLQKNRRVYGDLIHESAFVRCELIDRLLRWGKLISAIVPLSDYRIRALPSFHHVPQDDVWCPYSQFVWLSYCEDLRQKTSQKEEMLREMEFYHVPGKGYANQRSQVSSTLNATTAALAVKGQFLGWNDDVDIPALQRMQDDSGGFKATATAPVPDLLSTATALFLLNNYRVKPLFDASAFIDAHWLENGGFGATLADDESDVEYVFYGLLALGCI